MPKTQNGGRKRGMVNESRYDVYIYPRLIAQRSNVLRSVKFILFGMHSGFFLDSFGWSGALERVFTITHTPFTMTSFSGEVINS